MRKVSIALLVRIAVVLALLAGLIGVTAAPAGAVTAGFAVTVTPASAGRTAVYDITFVSAVALANTDTVTITFPTGTTIPAGGVGTSVLIGTAAFGANPAATTLVGTTGLRTMVITCPAGMDAGVLDGNVSGGVDANIIDPAWPINIRFLAAAGIVNPVTPSGANPAGVNTTHQLTAVTSTDLAGALSAAYAIAGFGVTVFPNLVGGATSGYTIVHQVGQIGAATYLPGTSTLTFTFPSGITLPATISRNTVTLIHSGVGADIGYPPTDPVVDTINRTVQVTIPATRLDGTTAYTAPAANETITTTFSQSAGIVNPKTATSAAGRVTTMTVAGSYNGGTEAAATSVNLTYIRQLVRSPTSGARGSTTTLTGQGYQASSGINFTLLGVNVGSTSSDTNGTFTATVAANVPPFAAGANAITATDGYGGAVAATFTLNPSIVLSSASGSAGSTVTITPRDFPANATFNVNSVTIGGLGGGANAVQTAPVPSTGAAFVYTLPPIVPLGAQTIIVTDSVNTTTTTATFTVTGRPVTLSPNTTSSGASVTLQGSGFTAGSGVYNVPIGSGIPANAITLQAVLWNTGVGTIPGNIPTDANGNFVVSLPVGGTGLAAIENLTPGVPLTVLVADNSGLQGTTTFTLKQEAITTSPATSGRGTSVVVQGTNFRVNGQATVNYVTAAGAVLGTTTASTDGGGSFTASLTVPLAAGVGATNTITATDTTNANITASATHSLPPSAVTANPTTVSAGSTMTVAGTGFPAYSAVAVLTIGGVNALPIPAPSTDASGNFSVSVLVPAVNTGAQPLAVTAGNTTASAAVTVVTAAQTPSTQLAPLITAGNLVRVWGFDAATQGWDLYDPAVPAQSDLTVLTRGQGYWLNVNTATSIVINGFTYNLVAGWNLIGWQG